MAKIYLGTELYGRLQQPDGTAVATKFFHFCYLPLIPLGCYRVFSENGPSFRGQKIGLRVGSVFSGYFKVWGFLVALGLAALGVFYADRREIPWAQFLAVPGGAIVLMGAVIASWLWLGTSPRTRGRVRVPLLSIGLPLLAMTGFFGYWWYDRYDFENRIEQMHEREAAEEAKQREEALAAARAAEQKRAAFAKLVPSTAGEGVDKGQRVLGLYGGEWYAGKVKRRKGDEIKVSWDDGTTSTLAPADVAPMPADTLLDAGTMAICRWSSAGHWWRARVTGRSDTDNDVEYSDGTTGKVKLGGCVAAR